MNKSKIHILLYKNKQIFIKARQIFFSNINNNLRTIFHLSEHVLQREISEQSRLAVKNNFQLITKFQYNHFWNILLNYFHPPFCLLEESGPQVSKVSGQMEHVLILSGNFSPWCKYWSDVQLRSYCCEKPEHKKGNKVLLVSGVWVENGGHSGFLLFLLILVQYEKVKTVPREFYTDCALLFQNEKKKLGLHEVLAYILFV